MEPPKEQIERMLRDGRKGLIVSVLCLGAAYAVKRGESLEDVEIQDPFTHAPLPNQSAWRAAMRACYDELKGGTPVQVDHAIALYTAHLKAAGYNVETGRVDN
jgi:hypothetical protein